MVFLARFPTGPSINCEFGERKISEPPSHNTSSPADYRKQLSTQSLHYVIPIPLFSKSNVIRIKIKITIFIFFFIVSNQ